MATDLAAIMIDQSVDRLVCPWFIRRFLDHDAVIIYGEPDWVKGAARAQSSP